MKVKGQTDKMNSVGTSHIDVLYSKHFNFFPWVLSPQWRVGRTLEEKVVLRPIVN